MNLLGKLSWSAIPFDQPIPLITSLILVLVIAGVLGARHLEGLVALSLARVDHQRRP